MMKKFNQTSALACTFNFKTLPALVLLFIFHLLPNRSLAQWTAVPTGTTNLLLGISMTSLTDGFAVGGGGTILKTTDAGLSWSSQTSGTSQNLYDVFFTDAMNGTAGGDNNAIVRTTDGGTTWNTISPPVPLSCRTIWFFNASTGYIVGGDSQNPGVILKTTDGGATWSDVSPTGQPASSLAFYSIYFTDANTGYTSNWDGRIWKSIDGGTTWSNSGVVSNHHLQGIYFTSSTDGYCAGFEWPGGNNSIILKTTDAGATWSPTTITGWDGLVDITFTSPTTGYASGGNVAPNTGIILKTTDSGATWTPQTTNPSPCKRLYRLFFASATNGYACGLNGTILTNIPVPCPNIGFSLTQTPLPCMVKTKITASAPTGGVPPYMYKLGNGSYSNTSMWTVTVSGNYAVTIKDAVGCTATQTDSVIVAAKLGATVTKTKALCFGQANGTATANTSGGTAPFSFNWLHNNVSIGTQQAITGLAAGSGYKLSVTDAQGCTKTVNFSILQPTLLTLNISSKTPQGPNFKVVLSALGGTAPKMYRRCDPAGNNCTIYQTSTTFNNTPVGNYQFQVKDANNCTATANTAVPKPAANDRGEPVQKSSFQIYPNPATETVEIVLSDENAAGQTIQIFDFTGKLVKTQAVTDATTETDVDISDLPKGVYLVKTGSGEGKKLTKM